MAQLLTINEKIIKQLSGYSGSKVFLMRTGSQYFVRKIGNVNRNYERLAYLNSKNFPVVKILNYGADILDLEYIPSLDIKTYLKTHNTFSLTSFIVQVINKFKEEKIFKDYTNVYLDKISYIDELNLPFKSYHLIDNLPKMVESSDYFGDLTLENILFNNEKGFILIDGSTTEYDSWVFDLAKLNQDLTCKWFLRNSSTNLDHKLIRIKNDLTAEFGEFNNYLTILMLLRVYKYALNDVEASNFLNERIEKLWK